MQSADTGRHAAMLVCCLHVRQSVAIASCSVSCRRTCCRCSQSARAGLHQQLGSCLHPDSGPCMLVATTCLAPAHQTQDHGDQHQTHTGVRPRGLRSGRHCSCHFKSPSAPATRRLPAPELRPFLCRLCSFATLRVEDHGHARSRSSLTTLLECSQTATNNKAPVMPAPPARCHPGQTGKGEFDRGVWGPMHAQASANGSFSFLRARCCTLSK